jgi:hypothetical protein
MKKENRLRVFENRVLKKDEEVTANWRRLHNEVLHDRCCSPNSNHMISEGCDRLRISQNKRYHSVVMFVPAAEWLMTIKLLLIKAPNVTTSGYRNFSLWRNETVLFMVAKYNGLAGVHP